MDNQIVGWIQIVGGVLALLYPGGSDSTTPSVQCVPSLYKTYTYLKRAIYKGNA